MKKVCYRFCCDVLFYFLQSELHPQQQLHNRGKFEDAKKDIDKINCRPEKPWIKRNLLVGN